MPAFDEAEMEQARRETQLAMRIREELEPLVCEEVTVLLGRADMNDPLGERTTIMYKHKDHGTFFNTSEIDEDGVMAAARGYAAKGHLKWLEELQEKSTEV